MNNIKEIISKNLVKIRKQRKLTQLELAEKINYSDKAVSRWENGEVTPDVETLNRLSEIYEIPLVSFFDENFGIEQIQRKNIQKLRNRIIIAMLAITMAWMLATIVYVYSMLIAGENFWQVFVYSFPVTFLLAVIFNALWGFGKLWSKKKFHVIFCSLLIWSLIISFYIHFLEYNVWPIFFLGAPMQIAVILWGNMK